MAKNRRIIRQERPDGRFDVVVIFEDAPGDVTAVFHPYEGVGPKQAARLINKLTDLLDDTYAQGYSHGRRAERGQS